VEEELVAAFGEAGLMLRAKRVWNRQPVSRVAAWLLGVTPPPQGSEVSLEEAGFYEVNGGGVALGPGELLEATRPTPLVRVTLPPCREVWVKLEWFNPYSMSMKDRPVRILLDYRGAEKVYEVSSGNTGLALASLATALGASVRVCLPRHAPRITESLIRLAGQEALRVDAASTDDVECPEEEGWVRLGQFSSLLNPASHVRGTGREVIAQLRSIGRRPTLFVAPIGTTGAFTGTGFALENYYGDVRLVAVEPREGEVLEGMRRPRRGWLWLLNDYEVVEVGRGEAARMLAEFAGTNGIYPGPSGSAALYAASKACDSSDVAVVLLPDAAIKYPDFVYEALEARERRISRGYPETGRAP